jgi:hypothetical protein
VFDNRDETFNPEKHHISFDFHQGSHLRKELSTIEVEIEGENPANGIYFVDQTTQERIKVETKSFVDNNPSEITIVIPNLPLSATYKLEITTQYSHGQTLKGILGGYVGITAPVHGNALRGIW